MSEFFLIIGQLAIEEISHNMRETSVLMANSRACHAQWLLFQTEGNLSHVTDRLYEVIYPQSTETTV